MSVIKRYVYDVTRRLPEKQRQDVAKELTAEIEAMVDDAANGKSVKNSHITTVLTELGDPAKFAEQYRDRKRYIIGPNNYDSYILLNKTLLAVILPIIAIIAFVSGFLEADQGIISLLFTSFGEAVAVGVHLVFWTTLVYVLLERANIDALDASATQKVWTPAQLPQLPAQQQIAKSESISGIVWAVVAIGLTLWQFPAIHAAIQPQSPLFFSDQMWPNWTVALLVIAVLSLVVEIIRLVIGKWNAVTVTAIAAINSIVIIFFASLLLYVQPIASESFTTALAKQADGADIGLLIDLTVLVTILSIIIASLYEMIRAIWIYIKSTKKEVS
jgi:uncharacterized membrane protein (DUF485 family)